MAEKDSLHGLSCPNCGGMVPIPEGQAIVHCPYCEQRSFVRGERGLRRYQVAQRVDQDKAFSGLQTFLKGHRAIAGDVAKKAKLTEIFVAFLPFWAVWAKALGWVFGEERVGSGDNARYKPREIKIVQEMHWNGAACDVGEFGVDSLPLTIQQMEPFNPEDLHARGMVFEPIGSQSDALSAADNEFHEQVRDHADLDRVAQVFTRLVHRRFGLVYYPLWVLRYLYRDRAFQVVIDGYTGKVLYGKAPGSTLYRALVLVGGMIAGAFLSIDVSSAFFAMAFGMEGDGDGVMALLALGGGAFLAGFGIMFAAYRKFRYGEIFEYRGHRKKKRRSKNLLKQISDVTNVLEMD
jgi:DNA-directed RNA polymerase subunit RPC12/RpoP